MDTIYLGTRNYFDFIGDGTIMDVDDAINILDFSLNEMLQGHECPEGCD